MIDRHWEGIAAYCKSENMVSLGFVEGLNNKIRDDRVFIVVPDPPVATCSAHIR